MTQKYKIVKNKSFNKRVGLYYGSFNPITIGHLVVARKALDDTELDEVWFVVSPENPDKKDSGELINAEHRLAMVDLAIDGIFDLKSCDVEFNLPQPSYTHVSLEVLRRIHPNTKFTIIGGTDFLINFNTWETCNEIIEHHDLLIYPRITSMDNCVSELINSKTTHLKNVPSLEISATYIRGQIKKNKSIKYLTPDCVIDYIKLNNLFE